MDDSKDLVSQLMYLYYESSFSKVPTTIRPVTTQTSEVGGEITKGKRKVLGNDLERLPFCGSNFTFY